MLDTHITPEQYWADLNERMPDKACPQCGEWKSKDDPFFDLHELGPA